MSKLSGRSFAFYLTALFTSVIAATYGFGVYLSASLMPEMRENLGFGYAAVGANGAARQIAFLTAALATPAAVHYLGAGRVIVGSMLVSTAALYGLAAARTTWSALGLLVILNASAAFAWIPMVSIVSRAVAFARQATAVSFIAGGTNYGLLANGLLVPAILPHLGWRSVWWAAGSLALTLCGWLWLTLRRAGFLASEGSGTHGRPLSWRVLFKRRFIVVYALAGLGGLAGVPFVNYVFFHARDDLHLPTAASGALWLAMGVSGVVGAPLLGSVGDRVGLRVALALAAAILCASSVEAAVASTGIAMMIAVSGFGASFFSIFGLLPAYVGKTAEERHTPSICALVECSLGLGGATGNAFGGLLRQSTGSFEAVFVCSTGVGLVMTTCIPLLTSEARRDPSRAQLGKD